MNLKLRSLIENDVKQMCEWIYEGGYSVYNFPRYEELIVQKWGITVEEKRKSQFVAVINQSNELCGFIRFIDNEGYVLVGLGLKPSLCGQGVGKELLEILKEESHRRFGDKKIDLEVRSFNKRAIKCYERAGFKITDRYMKDTLIGRDEFIRMGFRH